MDRASEKRGHIPPLAHYFASDDAGQPARPRYGREISRCVEALSVISALLPAYVSAIERKSRRPVLARLILTQEDLTLRDARRILNSDRVYGIAAGVVLVVGALGVAFFEKGPQYYFHSAPFIAKIALFALVGLLSIYRIAMGGLVTTPRPGAPLSLN